jgi:hypothetical protein
LINFTGGTDELALLFGFGDSPQLDRLAALADSDGRVEGA